MELVDIQGARVTVELDPGDCLALAQACRAQIRNDATPDYQLTAALAVALEGLGLAAYVLEDPHDEKRGRATLWAVWGPLETRLTSEAYHTGLDGKRADEPALEDDAESPAEAAPVCAEKGAA